MALAPETVKTIVTNSVTGTAGIVGTTVPSVQLSGARSQITALEQQKNTDVSEKINELKEQWKPYAEMAQVLMQYLNHFHNTAITGKGQSNTYKIHDQEFKNVKVADVSTKLKDSWQCLSKLIKEETVDESCKTNIENLISALPEGAKLPIVKEEKPAPAA